MPKRTYAQYCALARVFDVIGERWTPLVLRELRLGPRRYADLLDGLPGIGTSLLAVRLRDLEAEGIIRQRRLPPPAARNVYELTEDGAELAEALTPLARWGTRRMGRRGADEIFRLEWFLLYLRTAANMEATLGVHDVYEFHVDEHVFHVTVDDGRVDAHEGPAPSKPDVVITTDLDTLTLIGIGELDPADPDVAPRLSIKGDPHAAARSARILAPTVRQWRSSALG